MSSGPSGDQGGGEEADVNPSKTVEDGAEAPSREVEAERTRVDVVCDLLSLSPPH